MNYLLTLTEIDFGNVCHKSQKAYRLDLLKHPLEDKLSIRGSK
jgi:hypothetical protein